MSFRDFLNRNKKIKKYNEGGEGEGDGGYSQKYNLLRLSGLSHEQIIAQIGESPMITAPIDLKNILNQGLPEGVGVNFSATNPADGVGSNIGFSDISSQVSNMQNPMLGVNINPTKTYLLDRINSHRQQFEKDQQDYNSQESSRKEDLENASLSKTTTTEEKKEEDELGKWGRFVGLMHHDVSPTTAGLMLGKSIGFDSDIYNGHNKSGLKTANTLRGIGAGLKLGLDTARTIFAGIGHQKSMGEFYKKYRDDIRKGQVGHYNFEEGGAMQGMSDEEMAQLQAMADQQGISVEELLMLLQQQGSSEAPTQPTEEEMIQAQMAQQGQPSEQVPQGMPSEEEIMMLAEQYGVSPEEVVQMLIQQEGAGDPSAFGQVQGANQTEINPDEKSNNMTQEEVLVGDKRTGLATNKDQANAEVEAKEWIKRINGVTQEVVGRSHSEGGELVKLDKGDLVISDALKLGEDNAKRITEEFGIKVKATDSYADVLRKYSKESGLEELNKEQEAVYKKMGKVRDVRDENTNRLNQEFLSSKVREIEIEKEGMLETRSKLADILFDMQETSKVREGSLASQPTPKEEQLAEMEYGGMFENEDFKELARRYNVDFETAKKLTLNYLENNDKEDNVPTKNSDKNKQVGYNIDMTHRAIVRSGIDPANYEGKSYGVKANYQKQSKDKTGITYGQGDIRQLEYMYDNLRDLFDEYFVLEDGEVSLKEGKEVRGYQTAYNDYLEGNYRDIVEEFGEDSEEAKDFYDLKEKIKFTDDETSLSRGIDNKLGQYTLSRMAFYKPVIHKEDEKKFEELGIYGQKSLIRNWDKLDDKLKQRYQKEYDRAKKSGGNFNYRVIDTNGKGKEDDKPLEQPLQEVKQETKQDIPKEGEMKNNLKNVNFKNELFYMPDQSILPPNGISPHLKVEVNLEEIDPLKYSNKENMKEIGLTMDFASEQFSSMPESQRALNLANMVANSQENINKSVSQVAIANAQAQVQADQYNAQIHDKEEMTEAGNLLNYEQRQLTALDKTQDEWFNYVDYYRKLRMKNYQDYNKMANLNQIYDKFQIDPFGVVRFDYSKAKQLETSQNRSNTNNAPNVDNEEKDKKENKK